VAPARGSGIVLAFDFGRRRIGMATGNLRTRTASPLRTLASGREPPWADIDAVIADWRPERLIVGVPEASEGPTSIAAVVRAFVAALEQRYAMPVETVDEAFTSASAAADLAEARRSGTLSRRVQKSQIDARAACLIAEQWMSQARDDEPCA
jgi:putative holliday junction resolvase